ncbi:MAG: CaiB/BaiF CoA-transferase family protein, partial [Chloroflexota bacterium]
MNALEGILVLDLARRYPGAYSAMFLGDFGAEVIKVDPPGSTFPIPYIDSQSERFAAHFAPDRNKKSIIINLRDEKGREAFYQLVKRADVLIEGFRPGVMKRLGADYEALRQLNPRLIYCSETGYGPDGPYASVPAHDMNYIGIAGALSLVGPKDGPPYLPSNLLADMAGAGLHGAIGVLLALQARERTGGGQLVDISYIDTVISLLAFDASFYFISGRVPKRGETHTTGGSAWGNVYKCKDGEYFTLGCAEPHLWANLCRALGREDLIPLHNPETPEERQRVISELSAIFLTRTKKEWADYLLDKEACTGPVNNLNETFEDPQVRHRQ